VLARDWPALALGCAGNPFTSWQWFSAMAASAPPGSRLRVACAFDGDDVIGLLPLEWTTGPLGACTLRLPGSSWLGLDHMDLVAHPAWGARAAGAIWQAIRHAAGWDVLDLDALYGGAHLAYAASGASGRPGILRRRSAESVCPYVDLRPAGAQVIRSSGLRQQVRRGLRAAERAGGGFSVAREPAEAVALLDELMTMHNSRFGATSQAFSTPHRRAFHTEACRRLAAVGQARIYRLAVGDESAALLYALVADDRLYYYSLGFDERVEGSPGRTLLGLTAMDAADEGFRELDLLRGDHGFKQRLATAERRDVSIRLWRATPRGAALLARGPARRGARLLIAPLGRLASTRGRAPRTPSAAA
jgi:CelD/BcsL family acetyltransferase involved in cellulose biosynthesis